MLPRTVVGDLGALAQAVSFVKYLSSGTRVVWFVGTFALAARGVVILRMSAALSPGCRTLAPTSAGVEYLSPGAVQVVGADAATALLVEYLPG